VKVDGSVVTWGSGDSRSVAEQLSSGVQTVVGNLYAFAAVKVDGSVVTWGDAVNGGDSSIHAYDVYPNHCVAEQLSTGVQTVVGKGAFAAVKLDGSVVTWGNVGWGGDSRGVAEQLSSGVHTVVGNCEAFAAVKGNSRHLVRIVHAGSFPPWRNAMAHSSKDCFHASVCVLSSCGLVP